MSTFAKTISVVAVFSSFAAAADCAADGSCAKTDETSFVQVQSIVKYGGPWTNCNPSVYGVKRWVPTAINACADHYHIYHDAVAGSPELLKVFNQMEKIRKENKEKHTEKPLVTDMANCCYEWCAWVERKEREGLPIDRPAKDKSCKKSLQNCPDACMTGSKAPKHYLQCVEKVTELVLAKKTPAESKEKGITCCNALSNKEGLPFQEGQKKICLDMVDAKFEAKWDDKLCCVHD